MAQKADGKPARTERVAFTRPAAERIAKVVREVEAGNRDLGPISFGAAPGVASKTFRMATFSGAWSINSAKVVTLRGSTATLSAVNLLCGLNPSGPCDVSIAKDGTAWYLVQPNLTALPGYSSSGTQVMAVVSGNLRFVGTTAC